MEIYAIAGSFGAYVLLSLILTPVQYRYIKQLKEMDAERRELGLNQDEYYEKMGFEAQELHMNAQGNILFIGANLFAEIYYKWKHRKTA